MSERRGILAGRPWLRAWLVVALAAWATLGVLLVSRANNQGLVDDISISPYHLVGYAALLVLAVYVVWAFLRSLRRGRWRDAFPPLYGGLGIAFLLLLGWVILDPVWRDSLGIRGGIEGGLAPTRLLIPAALALLAAGPLREAIALRSERGLRPGELRIRWAGVVAAALVGASVTLVAFNPIAQPLHDWAYQPAADRSEIWTMAEDGSDQRRVLAALGDGRDYSLPAWSPDGTRIAFTTWTNHLGAAINLRNEDQSAAIWTMNADGSDARMAIDAGDPSDATPDHVWVPAWSPDGQWIAYTLSPIGASSAPPPGAPAPNQAPGPLGPPVVATGAQVWVARVDGSERGRISLESIDSVSGVWSPDGSRFAYIVGSSTGAQIHVATINVGLPGAVAAGPPQLRDDRVLVGSLANNWAPAWSPDGRWIVFSSNSSGNDDIWIVAADGSGEPRQLTSDPGPDWVPVFSPDGARIAFASDRTGDAEVWSMAADGTDPRNLSNNPGGFDGTWSISWSTDGRIAYGAGSFGPARASGWVFEDLAAAQMLFFGLALAGVALLVVALGAPLGAFAAALGVVAIAGAIPNDQWRFLPGAIVAGLLVDVLVRGAPARWRTRTAAAALAAFGTLAIGLTVGIGGTLAWSVTLLLGVALASAALGWALAEAAERLFPRTLGPEPNPTP